MLLQTTVSTISPVIIVDDDEFFRVAISTVLRDRFGVEKIVVCATTQEAFGQMSDGTRFGLALVDLNMPGIGNRDLLNEMKAAQPEMRLVVLSASRDREDILMALGVGAQGFVNKGLGINETEVAIRQIADGAVYVPPFTPQSGTCNATDEPGSSASLSALTPRQIEVLHLLIEGQQNKEIARALDINISTVKFHLSFIFRILGAENRVEAAMLGARLLRNG